MNERWKFIRNEELENERKTREDKEEYVKKERKSWEKKRNDEKMRTRD